MIEITCDTIQMIKLIEILDDSDICLCDCPCVRNDTCVECLLENIKWNIID